MNVSNLESMNITFHFRGLAFIQHFTAKLRAAVNRARELFIENTQMQKFSYSHALLSDEDTFRVMRR